MSASASIVDTVSAQLSREPIGILERHLRVLGSHDPRIVVGAALRLGANSIGRSLVESRDAIELEMKIDEVLGRAQLQFVLRLMREGLSNPEELEPDEVPNPGAMLSPTQWARLVGEEPRFIQQESLRAQAQKLQEPLATKNSWLEGPTLLERLYSPTLPPQVGLLLLDGYRAEAASLAIFHATFRRRPLEPWMEEALVTYIIVGLQANLRMLASLPGMQVDDQIVPLEDRLDLVLLGEQTARAERGMMMMSLLADAQDAAGLEPRMPWEQAHEES